jgi:hypothetical protein
MDQAVEDRIKVIVDERLIAMDFVGRKFCIERHQGVKTLEEKVKSLDNRLWGLIVLAVVQLGGLVAILLQGK